MSRSLSFDSPLSLPGLMQVPGCLPTLATILVWIGLYRALSNVADEGLLTEGFFWMPSLFGPTTIAAHQNGRGISWLFPFVVLLEQIKEEESKDIALNPDKWIEFKLQDTARVSHNTQLFRFSFDPTKKLGLDVASCIITRAPLGQDAEGKTNYVIRPYTPISDPESKGYFDLLIKVYPEGKMSQHFASLKPGDVVEVKGPIEKLRYTPNMKKHIGMIAGGTGISPMLQVIEAILKNPHDKTQISLLYANVSPDDILLKQKLDILAASHPNLKIFYIVDNPTKNWRGGAGHILKDMVVKGLPSPSDDTLVLVAMAARQDLRGFTRLQFHGGIGAWSVQWDTGHIPYDGYVTLSWSRTRYETVTFTFDTDVHLEFYMPLGELWDGRRASYREGFVELTVWTPVRSDMPQLGALSIGDPDGVLDEDRVQEPVLQMFGLGQGLIFI